MEFNKVDFMTPEEINLKVLTINGDEKIAKLSIQYSCNNEDYYQWMDEDWNIFDDVIGWNYI